MNDKPKIKTKYDLVGAVMLVLLMSYLVTVLYKNERYLAVLIVIITGWIIIAINTKKAVFGNDSVFIYYPMRIFQRKRSIKYDDIIQVEKSHGSYLDRTSLIIRFNNKSGNMKKIVLLYPDTRSARLLAERLEKNNVIFLQ